MMEKNNERTRGERRVDGKFEGCLVIFGS